MVKRKSLFCRSCQQKTLHVKEIKKQNLGCGFIAANLFLSVVTLGLWFPIFIFVWGLGTFGNTVAPLAAKYYCQVCGKKKF